MSKARSIFYFDGGKLLDPKLVWKEDRMVGLNEWGQKRLTEPVLAGGIQIGQVIEYRVHDDSVGLVIEWDTQIEVGQIIF